MGGLTHGADGGVVAHSGCGRRLRFGLAGALRLLGRFGIAGGDGRGPDDAVFFVKFTEGGGDHHGHRMAGEETSGDEDGGFHRELVAALQLPRCRGRRSLGGGEISRGGRREFIIRLVLASPRC